MPRADNANGARAKNRHIETIPVSAALLRLYGEYMHAEYGTLDSDYVFVNLWAQPWGQPLTYNAVNQLVRRLRARTGIGFTAHMFRHSAATEMVRAGVPIEVRPTFAHPPVLGHHQCDLRAPAQRRPTRRVARRQIPLRR